MNYDTLKDLKVYCAGPLFNPPEQEEMAKIAKVVEDAGHTTFLPQRDGLEFARLLPALIAKGMSSQEASHAMERAVFNLDVYRVLGWSDVVVANLNGRVPDEGMVVEAALAWHGGKGLVLYKRDVRSLIAGSDNPMVRGLTDDFKAVDSIEAIPDAIAQSILAARGRLERTLSLGAAIAGEREKKAGKKPQILASALVDLLKAQ